MGLLRSALYRAAKAAGAEGLTHEVLTQRVFDSLALSLDLYAADSTVKYQALQQTQKALRDVIGYRLYRDLRRGWRITSPNLEQTGLLRIEYESLDELAADADTWRDCHAALVSAKPETRKAIARVVLDYLRRELAIKVDYLAQISQEQLVQVSNQRLRSPWALDENEVLEFASIAFPRAQGDTNYRGWTFLSPRGGLGQYLRRANTFPDLKTPLKVPDTEAILGQLMVCLRVAGLVEEVQKPEDKDDVPGYQIPASAMRWVAGEGTAVAHDPIRVPNRSAQGSRPNQFFLDFYKNAAADGQGLEAREHTAQVPYEAREDREQRFRQGTLPVLFCSPTMELGVDISSLNVVNMRNVPPSPANYAQRSGRAGRSGQPALVVTYCSAGSPHDQYFFRHQERMVSGQVTPPRLDLANEDLVRAHVQSLWLAESGMSLGRSLKDLLDVGGEPPTLELQSGVRADVAHTDARRRAKTRAETVLSSIRGELEGSNWWGPTWLSDVFQSIPMSFEEACNRWRSLYRAARAQAEAQLELLTATGAAIVQSDFYSYRYFASEGFLPGYSFPRLPLSAFIPGRKSMKGVDEFLSRPRFLAISEFGPRNFIYHEGSRYAINRVILPVTESADPVTGRAAITRSAKLCKQCGYTHPLPAPTDPDKCENCGSDLGAPMRQLFRLQNVATQRRERINSDEEERQRQGYQIESTIRFSEAGGRVARQTATVEGDDGRVAGLTYGHAATVWRVNLGWKRRKEDSELGFVLDIERGYWAKDTKASDDDEPPDPMSPRTERVVPYVEDRKNCLILEPAGAGDPKVMASLQAALRHAIEVEFQLEDTELAAEPLPKSGNRRYILFYESAEGGAGVLRQIVEDGAALGRVARRALEICHYDPVTGADLGGPPWRSERCEAACYDCLMSYTNQPDHPLLDRKLLAGHLSALTKARVSVAPGSTTRDEHFEQLNRIAASGLERRWLKHLMDGGYRLPSDAGVLVEKAATRPDFLYRSDQVAVYIDGPPHDHPERAERDAQKQEAMANLGYTVLRFRHDEDWGPIIKKYPGVFGAGGSA